MGEAVEEGGADSEPLEGIFDDEGDFGGAGSIALVAADGVKGVGIDGAGDEGGPVAEVDGTEMARGGFGEAPAGCEVAHAEGLEREALVEGEEVGHVLWPDGADAHWLPVPEREGPLGRIGDIHGFSIAGGAFPSSYRSVQIAGTDGGVRWCLWSQSAPEGEREGVEAG